MALKRKRSEKHVSFSDSKPPVFYYTHPKPSSEASHDFIRASHQRTAFERAVLKHPKAQLNRVRHFVALWKWRDLSIVWGHLGRQPYLLHYYLDLCFGSNDTVKVVCDWDFSFDSSEEEEVDFLIRVEPPFGFTVQKEPKAKHVIFFTSHLVLCYWGPEAALDYYYLPLSSRSASTLPDPHLEASHVFQPPPFHTEVLPDECSRQQEPVLLDVSKAQTVHEAYLRLLTGREMLGPDQPFNLRLHPKDTSLLKINLDTHRQRVQALWDQKRWHFTNKTPQNVDNLWMDTFLYHYLNQRSPIFTKNDHTSSFMV